MILEQKVLITLLKAKYKYLYCTLIKFNTNFESKIRTKRLELLRETPTSA